MPNVVEILGGFTGMKLRLLTSAGVIVLAGFALNVGQWMKADGDISPAATSERSALRSDLSEGGALQEFKERSRTWGDAATGLGMSFIVAMMAASLLRAFLKTMATLALGSVIALYYLQSKGVVDPEWLRYFQSVEEFRDWALSQTESVKVFLQGSVPSMGAALVGFGFGLRR